MFWESLLGALVGGGAGAYVAGLFTEKGRLAATKAAFSDILQQERDKAFQQESGKRAASHADIENVLEELTRVTESQKSIESRIAGDLWRRQWELESQKSAYVGTLQIVFAMENHMAFLLDSLKVPQANPSDLRAQDEHWQALADLALRFRQEQPLLEIFGSPAVLVAMKRITEVFEVAHPNVFERTRRTMELLQAAKEDFVEAARLDLRQQRRSTESE